MRRIRRLPVFWYYALKMRHGWKNPHPFGDPGRMVRVAASTSIYADPEEW